MGLALVQEEVATTLNCPHNGESPNPPLANGNADESKPLVVDRIEKEADVENNKSMGSNTEGTSQQPLNRLVCHDKLQEWQTLLGEVYGSAQTSVDVLNGAYCRLGLHRIGCFLHDFCRQF